MELNVVRYNENYRNQWNDFVNASINGTFLHTREFFDHNPLNLNDDYSLIFFKKNHIVAVIPANLYTNGERKILHSSLRATYGGFVIGDQIGAEEAVELVHLLKISAQHEGVNEIITRNPFRIFNSRLCDDTDYAMWYHGFKIYYRELETSIELGDYVSVSDLYHSSTLRSINKAISALTITQSVDFRKFWDILEKNLNEKYGVSPTHSYSQFINLYKHVGPERIKLFTACFDSKIIAGIILFIANKSVIHAQYICSHSDFQIYRPLNGVIDEIIRWGCNNGFKYLNLGTSNFDAGKGINAGLFRFKEGFGGRNVLRETMHLVL